MTLQSVIHREPQPCLHMELRCTNHGPVRMAIDPEDPPPADMPCPYCDELAPAKVLGTGHTRRILPYFDLAPNLQALDSIQSISSNSRPLVHGQLVCFSEEPDIVHFAKVHDVFTSLAHMKGGVPSISFIVNHEETEPIPHRNGAETLPWWCFPDELPKGEAKANATNWDDLKHKASPEKREELKREAHAALVSGQCSKGKHALCKAKVCGCECHGGGK